MNDANNLNTNAGGNQISQTNNNSPQGTNLSTVNTQNIEQSQAVVQPQVAAQPQNIEQSKVNNEHLDNLVNAASKHLNTSPEDLKKVAQNGNIQKLLNNMSPSQAAQLQRILSDENAAKKLLSTPQAQALLRGLQKKE